MIKLLLDHGADKSLTVEDYRPVDLIKPDRAHALQQFRMNSFGRKQDRLGCFLVPRLAETSVFSFKANFGPKIILVLVLIILNNSITAF